MTRVLVDDVLLGKLRHFREPLELCDAAGMVVARVTPVAPPNDLQEPPPLSEEELQRREEEADFSTAELLACLENT